MLVRRLIHIDSYAFSMPVVALIRGKLLTFFAKKQGRRVKETQKADMQV